MKNLFFLLSLSLSLSFSFCQVLSCGRFHTLAICNDSTVMGIGNNLAGQLGLGDYSNTSVFMPVTGLSEKIVQVETGNDGSFFLTKDSTVWASGYNYNGQLGDGTVLNYRNIPVQVLGLTGVISISAGQNHTLFLKADGTVWAVGNNAYGQLGNGTTTGRIIASPIEGLSGIKYISAGYLNSFFIKNDGSVYATGSNLHGELGDGTNVQRRLPVRITTLSNIKAVAAGSEHTLFLKTDGTVYATGSNTDNQLGNPSVFTRIPQLVHNVYGISSIAAGEDHSIFIKYDGTVWVTGNNGAGQLGIGSTSYVNLPMQILTLNDIVAASTGRYHTFFYKSDGTIFSTGSDEYGQLGNGLGTSLVGSTIPQPVTGLCSLMEAKKNHQYGVYGYSFKDNNENCVNEGEAYFTDHRSIIQPGNYIVQTNQFGYWYMDSLPAGSYTIHPDSTSNWFPSCDYDYDFVIDSANTFTLVSDFGYITTNHCQAPNVSIHMPSIQPCLPNQKIYITSCNESSGDQILANAYTTVQLDPLITFQNASISFQSLGNNLYRFNHSHLYPGDCASFTINAQVSCDAAIGQTLCLEANLFPAVSCALDTVPGFQSGEVAPCSTNWDGSNLDISVGCVNDTIVFSIKNTGIAGNNDMSCYSPVRIYLDEHLFLMDSILLNGQETTIYTFPGQGKTWRLELDQHPLHPGNSNPSASIERCGDTTNWTPGLINLFSYDDAEPMQDIYCGQVSESSPSNEKQTDIIGIDVQHYISPNQDLEYTISFQNTGTDTAYRVVIRDTLATELDIFSVETGASSHPYTFSIHDQRILEWTFDTIFLPDSNTNLNGSLGFVKFRVSQNRDLANNTEIKNKADIFMDSIIPIRTNQTLHTINSCIDYYPFNYVTDVQVCDTLYLFHDSTYTQSGQYTYDRQINDCNIHVALNLTVLHSSTSFISDTVCETYTAPDGQVYTNSGQYTSVISNAISCDSIVHIDLTVKRNTYTTISETVCGSYTAPDGQILTSSGTYLAILPNSIGCDSLITINLIVNNNSSANISETTCETYTAPDGQIYTNSGTYSSVIPNMHGCDSLITINLVINHHTNSTITDTVCGIYIAPDGQSYSSSGTYLSTIPNTAGCDSLITINLQVNNIYSTISETVCESYTAPDGQVYTASGTYTAIIQNANNCDSTITIHLTIKENTSSSISETACDLYIAPDGQTYTSSGTYIAIIPNSSSCDSIVTISLSIPSPDATIEITDDHLEVSPACNTYQWFECEDSTELNGQVFQAFHPVMNGYYGVQITDNGCIDTLDCVLFDLLSLNPGFNNEINVFPNPSKGKFKIEFGSSNPDFEVQIYDLVGKLIYHTTTKSTDLEIELQQVNGVYFLNLRDSKRRIKVYKLIIE